jgi:hypothetical protein
MALIKLNNQSVAPVTTLPNLASLPSGIDTGKIAQAIEGSSAGVVSTSSDSYSVINTVNITPTASSSKIILIGTVGEPDQVDGRLEARFFRDSTELNDSERKICTEVGRGLSNTGAETHRGNISQHCIDVPNTTSQITYTIKIKRTGSGTVRVGNGGSNTLLVMELLA